MTKELPVGTHAARGLPDAERAALLSLDAEGNYDPVFRDVLLECAARGIVERLEECGDEHRAPLTPYGRAVVEALRVEVSSWVIQSDRDAAANYLRPSNYWAAEQVLRSALDSHPLADSFARHRIATLRATNSAVMIAGESERRLSSEGISAARADHATASRSSDGSGTRQLRQPSEGAVSREEIEDFCQAVLADNFPRHDEPFATIGRYINLARRRAYKSAQASSPLREALTFYGVDGWSVGDGTVEPTAALLEDCGQLARAALTQSPPITAAGDRVDGVPGPPSDAAGGGGPVYARSTTTAVGGEEVAQADRDAAAERSRRELPLAFALANSIRLGEEDGHEFVQDAVRHRLAPLAPSADYVRGIEDAADIAEAIDSGRGNEAEIAKAIRRKLAPLPAEGGES